VVDARESCRREVVSKRDIEVEDATSEEEEVARTTSNAVGEEDAAFLQFLSRKRVRNSQARKIDGDRSAVLRVEEVEEVRKNRGKFENSDVNCR